MDNSDCRAALWVEARSVDNFRVDYWLDNIDTGAMGNSGIDDPELDLKVGNSTFDDFPFVIQHSGRYSSSSSLLTVSALICISNIGRILL